MAGVTFVTGAPPNDADVEVKVRYRSRPVPATLEPAGGAGWRVMFTDPQPGVAPGQAAVFYRGDAVVGGGTISAPVRRGNVSLAAGSVQA